MNTELRLYQKVDYPDLNNLPGYSVIIDESAVAWQYLPFAEDDEGLWSYQWSNARDPLERVQLFDGPFVLLYFPEQA